ncbi:MAG: cytochrome C [Planctomycetes bacterium]|nr:cytochrome C [Planctomycetota bacterium]NOG53759.1 cytochrome C [Planctomycetota bacterium]
MKTKTALLTGAAGLALGLMVVTAPADIVGSAHDFSGEGWSDNEICKPCHTPHHSMVEVTRAPLWNHALPDIGQVYNLHSGDYSRDDALDGRSVLCMGCHDGTVALDSYGGATGGDFINGDELIGTDLVNDHPVGRDGIYPLVPWMNDPSTWEGGHGPHLEDMIIDGNPERVVSCTTCHEPHNRQGLGMLWRSNDASALCLMCHIK